jgi:hypothetical protein
VRQLCEVRTQRLAPIQRLGVQRTETQRVMAREFIAQAQTQQQRQSRGIRM